MSDDPYVVLGLPTESDDETIRRRYLELVRQYTPEQHPQKFAAIRSAYEKLRDVNTRLRFRLFDTGRHDSLEALVEEVSCRSPRRRVPLKTLLQVVLRP